jgi:hypothetical protein
MLVTMEAFLACQQMLMDHRLTTNERDAAGIAIQAYRTGRRVDHHVAGVLAGYAGRVMQQDQWGK